MTQITITQPDDWHLHLRDHEILAAVLPDTARRFARAIVMPNLKQPVTTTAKALAYRQRVLDALPAGLPVEPLRTLYLTDNTSPHEISEARSSGYIHAVKWYPAGATTNSDAGVSDIHLCDKALAAMEEHDLPLLVHGEVTDPAVDIFDREQVFIEQYLIPLVEKFPRLRVVLEHITTRQAVEFVQSASPQVAATITAHHLLLNRNALFTGGIRPHHYCLPVLKRRRHQEALIDAAISGNPSFFLGTDSAPHLRGQKESACGCAGIYTAHAALELYADVFERMNALDRLESFAAHHGADFYRLPRNAGEVTLEQAEWEVAAGYRVGQQETSAPAMGEITPLLAGETLRWKLRGSE